MSAKALVKILHESSAPTLPLNLVDPGRPPSPLSLQERFGDRRRTIKLSAIFGRAVARTAQPADMAAASAANSEGTVAAGVSAHSAGADDGRKVSALSAAATLSSCSAHQVGGLFAS